MKGYNLPDNINPSDPNAPWNKEEEQLCEYFEKSTGSDVCLWRMYSGRCGKPDCEIPLIKCKED
jgi:hypothetical protein